MKKNTKKLLNSYLMGVGAFGISIFIPYFIPWGWISWLLIIIVWGYTLLEVIAKFDIIDRVKDS